MLIKPKNLLKKLSVKQRVILYLLLGLVSFVFNYWPLALIFLVISSYLVSRLIERDYFKTTISGSILGFTLLFASYSAFASLLWAAQFEISLIKIGVLTNIIVVALLVLMNKVGLITSLKHTGTYDLADLTSIAVVILFFGLYVHSSRIANPTLSPTIEAIQNTTKALDDQNHFGMYADTLNEDKGLLLGNRGFYRNNTLLSVYPKGVHVSSAVISETTRGFWEQNNSGTTNPLDALKSYALTKFLVFILAVFTLSRFSMEVFRKFKKTPLLHRKRETLMENTLGALISFYIVTMFLTPLFMDGAFSIIPIFMFIPLAILSYADNSTSKPKLSSLMLVGSLAVAASLAWTIAGIPIYIALIILGIKKLYHKKHINFDVPAFSIILTALLLGSVQYYVQFQGKVEVLNVNTLGGFFTFSTLLPLVVSAVVLGTYRVTVSRESSSNLFYSTLLFTSILFGMCALISILNFKTTGAIQYYFIKLLYLPFVLLAFFAAGIAINFFISLRAKSRLDTFILRSSSALLVFAVLFIAFPANLSIIDYLLKGNRSVSDRSASILATELSHYKKNTGTATFILSDSVPHFENVMSNHTLNGLSKGDYCQGLVFDKLYKNETTKDLFSEDIVSKCKEHKIKTIRIITNSNNYDQLTAKYAQTLNIVVEKP